MAESGSVIGKVASVLGQAFAKGPDGIMRPIKVGDPVFEGDVIQAAPDGHVELVFRDGTAYFARDNESVTLDGRVFGDSAGQIGNIVGKVVSVEGQVFAKGADGAVRQLRVGDPVYEGEVIQTSVNGRVELSFNNGTAYFLRDKESVTLDGMVFGDRAADAKEAALMPGRGGELEDITRALAEGNSLDQLLEETSAGRPTLFGRTNEGYSFVQLLRIVETIDPLGYQFGTRDGRARDGGTQDGIVGGGSEGVAVPSVSLVKPIVSNVSGSGAEDAASISVGLSASDIDGTIASYTISTLPANGTLYSDMGLTTVVSAGDTVTGATLYFVPAADWNGSTGFNYTATDNMGLTSDLAMATVNVTAVNDTPVLGNYTVSLDENIAAGTAVQTVAATDADGDPVTYSISGGNAAGIFTINSSTGAISIAAGQTLDYETATQHVLTVSASDGTLSDTAAVTVNLNNLNDNAPNIVDATVAIDENVVAGTAVTDVSDSFTGSDLDRDGAAITYSITGGNGAGIFQIDANTGAITIAPDKRLDYENATSHSLIVSASDGSQSDTATITINVTDAPNDRPVANNDSGSIDEDLTLTVAAVSGVKSNDTDQNVADVLTITAFRTGIESGSGTPGAFGVALAGTYGSLTLNSDGSYTYVADTATALAAGVTATDTFTYTISDGSLTDDAQLVITVTGTNDLPVIAGMNSGAVTEDVSVASGNLNIGGTLTIADPDAGESAFNTGSVTYTGGGIQLGTLTIDSAGVWSYAVPNADVQYLGAGATKVETFTVAAVDGTTQTITVTINGEQDDPAAESNTIPIPKNETRIVTVDDLGISDADSTDTLVVEITSLVTGGGVLWHYNGTAWVTVAANDLIPVSDIENQRLVFVPATGDTGNSAFSFTLTDGPFTTAVQTLTYAINTELSVSSPLPVDEGRATVFAIDLSDVRAVATTLSLTRGGDATAADYDSPLQYRVQNPSTGVYSIWTDVAGDVTIPAGYTHLEVKVKTVSDAVLDEFEALTLTATITSASNSDMANTSATGATVISDLPSLVVSGPSYVNEGGIAAFQLELSSTKATGTAVIIRFEGVAVLGTDFDYSIDGGTTWITAASSTVTLAASTTSSPTFEVLVRTLTETPNEVDEVLRLVAITGDSGIANGGTDVSAQTYVVDPVTATVLEDTLGGVTITPPGGYTYTALGAAAHGTVVDNNNGTLTYTPDPDYSGTDSFTITKTNEVGLTVNSVVNVTVTADADVPTVEIDVLGPYNNAPNATNYIANGSFETFTGGTGTNPLVLPGGTNNTTNLSGWSYTTSGGSDLELYTNQVTSITGSRVLDTSQSGKKSVDLTQTITGLTQGDTYELKLDLAIPATRTGVLNIVWNGVTLQSVSQTALTSTLTTFTYRVVAGATNTLLLDADNTGDSGGGDATGVFIDNVRLTAPDTYTYTVNVGATLNDVDGSESLTGSFLITGTGLPADAVLRTSSGTLLTRSGTGPYTWTVTSEADLTGLQLTMIKPLVGTGNFTLSATATSIEASNSDTATGSATTAAINMPTNGSGTSNLVPEIGDADVILANDANFVGSVTQTIDTTFGDGTNTFSWVSTLDSLPDIYVGGELVTYTLTVTDGQTGTITGSTAGSGTVFQLVIALNASGDADVTYTQYAELGSATVTSGDSMAISGGNGTSFPLTFGTPPNTFTATVTGSNSIDGTGTTINTSSKYIGAANNLMNPGERITLAFDAATTGNAVSTMVVSFFNFDSASASAPDELTITATDVNGAQFVFQVTNASLDANGFYTIATPGGTLIDTLVFEAGSESSFKLGIENVNIVNYDINFELSLDYQLTDADGESATGTISLTLDGDDNATITGTLGADVLLGGITNETVSGLGGSDLISGGGGNDTLSGGLNDLATDVFQWSFADRGTAVTPAVDTITDFSTAAAASGGDVLDLRDLLQVENSGNLADYLHFEKVGSDTLVHIKSAGATGSEDQTVVLQGVDLYAAAGVGIGAPDQDIINDLVAKGKLITD